MDIDSPLRFYRCDRHMMSDPIRIEPDGGLQMDVLLENGDANRTITVEQGGQLQLFTAIFGSVQMDLTIELRGTGASVVHHLLYIGQGEDRIRIRTNTEHYASDTSAKTVVHGIALDAAHVDFAGSINIHQTGARTDGELEHEGLLLSDKARINALPGFEIGTNDVRAAHSSAVHFVKQQDLFYLQSRGIEEQEARRLIVAGFVEEMNAQIIGEEMRKDMDKRIEAVMQQL